MNTTAEKYVKMVADTDAAVNFYMEMEGGRFFLTFLAEALMELLEAEELTSVTLLLRKFFEAAGSNTPECLSDDSTAFASAQCVELLSELLAEQFPADAELCRFVKHIGRRTLRGKASQGASWGSSWSGGCGW